jgi:chromosome condensin MukBEF ATPase and DNA-binding subunit MukB
MSPSRSTFGMCFLLVLILQFGCDSSSKKVEEMRARHEEMKQISGEFVEALKSVQDVESAKTALPRLEKVCEKMFTSGQQLEEVANTSLRSAAGLKQEMEAFRVEQKKIVDKEIARIGEMPEAAEILEPLLKNYGFFGSQSLVPF